MIRFLKRGVSAGQDAAEQSQVLEGFAGHKAQADLRIKRYRAKASA